MVSVAVGLFRCRSSGLTARAVPVGDCVFQDAGSASPTAQAACGPPGCAKAEGGNWGSSPPEERVTCQLCCRALQAAAEVARTFTSKKWGHFVAGQMAACD